MNIPLEEFTPKQIVAELDKYIVGQDKAKRAVAVALRNRYRRQSLPVEQRKEIIPKNILMIGPTGVGKTEIARRLAQLAKAPFIKVEATKFTEVGYVGRDVDSMIRDLVNIAVRMVEHEKMEEVLATAKENAVNRITDILLKPKRKAAPPRKDSLSSFESQLRQTVGQLFGGPVQDPFEPSKDEDTDESEDETSSVAERKRRKRAKLKQQIIDGVRDEEKIMIDVEESTLPFLQVFSPQGMEEMGMDMNNAFSGLPKHQVSRQVTIAEAKRILTDEEARKMIDNSQVTNIAIERVEQSGIIFLDELDKVAGRESGHGPDVSREGVQRDLLPIIEGSSVVTKYGAVQTDHILFIAAGAFHVTKPSDLIPELQGRLPIRVELDNLSESDFERILTEPRNALTLQYEQLLATEGVKLTITPSAVSAIAKVAADVNARMENIGARRLHTILERVLEEILFQAPDIEPKEINIDAEYVHKRLEGIVEDADISRYIL